MEHVVSSADNDIITAVVFDTGMDATDVLLGSESSVTLATDVALKLISNVGSINLISLSFRLANVGEVKVTMPRELPEENEIQFVSESI